MKLCWRYWQKISIRCLLSIQLSYENHLCFLLPTTNLMLLRKAVQSLLNIFTKYNHKHLYDCWPSIYSHHNPMCNSMIVSLPVVGIITPILPPWTSLTKHVLCDKSPLQFSNTLLKSPMYLIPKPPLLSSPLTTKWNFSTSSLFTINNYFAEYPFF